MATAAIQHPVQPPPGSVKGAAVQVVQERRGGGGGEKRDVRTVLNFFKTPSDGKPPHDAHVDRPETYDRETEGHEVTVHDVRGDEARHTLDGSGFQFVRRPVAERDFLDDEAIKKSYYRETEDLLKSVTGANRVFIFDHTIRRQPPRGRTDTGATTTAEDGSQRTRAPVQMVHIDQSYSASLARVPYHIPDDADELLKGRVQIINVWRPIRTVERDPLAVAEASSVAEDDLVPIGLVYPDRRGEILNVRHVPGQRWYYKSRLEPDEALLIKCFDSKTDGRARRVPHTAFVDPTAAEDAPTRQSIEVRALVFHTDDRD